MKYNYLYIIHVPPDKGLCHRPVTSNVTHRKFLNQSPNARTPALNTVFKYMRYIFNLSVWQIKNLR